MGLEIGAILGMLIIISWLSVPFINIWINKDSKKKKNNDKHKR